MAKWSDLAGWCGPTVNQGGKMSEQRGVVIHIAEGSYDGTIAWQKNPSAQVSSHFIAAKDGRACQMVDTGTVAWTQANGNGKWLSIENEGSVPDKLTDHQIEFAAQILARAYKDYGVPLQIASSPSGRGLGHHSMGCNQGWGHCSCPGNNIINQKPAIVARAKEIVEGDVVLSDDDIEKIVNGVWHRDGSPAIANKYFWWRADSPGHTPPGTNEWITGGTAVIEVAGRADKALQTAEAALAGIAELKAMLTAGVEVPALVGLTPEAVAAVADATADEIHNDPERDG